MNTLRAVVCRTCRLITRAGDSTLQESTRGLTRQSSKKRSDQIPRKSGKKFYKNVITQKRDEQYKQIAELESISKSLSKQRRNPALKLKHAPLPVNTKKTHENATRIRNNDAEGPILDRDYSPLTTFSPDLLARAQHLFTKAPLTRRVAESVEQVRSTVFELHGTRLPEIAIVGRSNVGKSSLLNALLARNKALTGTANINICTSSCDDVIARSSDTFNQDREWCRMSVLHPDAPVPFIFCNWNTNVC